MLQYLLGHMRTGHGLAKRGESVEMNAYNVQHLTRRMFGAMARQIVALPVPAG
jgi:hypothetical protein